MVAIAAVLEEVPGTTNKPLLDLTAGLVNTTVIFLPFDSEYRSTTPRFYRPPLH
jgi:hypothetical protein